MTENPYYRRPLVRADANVSEGPIAVRSALIALDPKRKFLRVCGPAAIRGKAEIPGLPISRTTTRPKRGSHTDDHGWSGNGLL